MNLFEAQDSKDMWSWFDDKIRGAYQLRLVESIPYENYRVLYRLYYVSNDRGFEKEMLKIRKYL